MTDAAIAQRLDALTKAVLLMSMQTGKRLTREDMCERLGIHRHTLRVRSQERGFPQPDINGKWLLSEVLEWEFSRA